VIVCQHEYSSIVFVATALPIWYMDSTKSVEERVTIPLLSGAANHATACGAITHVTTSSTGLAVSNIAHDTILNKVSVQVAPFLTTPKHSVTITTINVYSSFTVVMATETMPLELRCGEFQTTNVALNGSEKIVRVGVDANMVYTWDPFAFVATLPAACIVNVYSVICTDPAGQSLTVDNAGTKTTTSPSTACNIFGYTQIASARSITLNEIDYSDSNAGTYAFSVLGQMN